MIFYEFYIWFRYGYTQIESIPRTHNYYSCEMQLACQMTYFTVSVHTLKQFIKIIQVLKDIKKKSLTRFALSSNSLHSPDIASDSMLDISAFILSLFRNSKAQKEVWMWRETNSIAGANFLSSSVFMKLERKGRKSERTEEFVGWIYGEKGRHWSQYEDGEKERSTNQGRESRRHTDVNEPQEGIWEWQAAAMTIPCCG